MARPPSRGKVDDPGLLGRRAADHVDERKIGGEKLVAADHPDAGVELLGELDGLLLERVRPQRMGLTRSRPKATPAAMRSSRSQSRPSGATSRGFGAKSALNRSYR